MNVENCRYLKKAKGMFEDDPDLKHTPCGNPKCKLTIGLFKETGGKRVYGNDPLKGTPHPVAGFARCVMVEINYDKTMKFLRKKGLSEDVRTRKMKDIKALTEVARNLEIL